MKVNKITVQLQLGESLIRFYTEQSSESTGFEGKTLHTFSDSLGNKNVLIQGLKKLKFQLTLWPITMYRRLLNFNCTGQFYACFVFCQWSHHHHFTSF